jgi:arylsulfatase A-like enzyme
MRALARLLCLAVCACAPEPAGLPPRDIVIVTFDGLRADHLSCYAHARPSSALPSGEQERLEGRAFALDDLAAGGVTFAQAFAPSPHTLPSLATLFTGQSPAATGVLDDRSRLSRELPTLAELARAAGFQTAAFVSRPDLDVLASVGRGFEDAQRCASDSEALARARGWLAQDFGDERRRLVWIHLCGLEPPWPPIPPEEILRPECAPKRFLDPAYRGPADGSAAFFARLASGAPALEPADRAALSELYDGRIAAVAGALSGFLQDAFDYNKRGAEATEFWARTLLVVTATHGLDLGLRGNAVRAELQDDLLRVPLILRHPDSLGGPRVLEPVVELADVLPTLVELCQLPRPRELPGRSLLSALEPRSAVTQSAERIFSASDGRWRMIWSPYFARLAPDDPRREQPIVALYENGGDRDSAAAHPDVVARLQQSVVEWIARQHFRPSLPLVPGRSP